MATAGRVLAFVLAEIVFALLAAGDASSRQQDGANIGAGFGYVVLHLVAALLWGAFDGRGTRRREPVLVRWAIVSIIAAVSFAVCATVGYGAVSPAQLLPELVWGGSAIVLITFVPAALGALGAVRASRRTTPFFPTTR